MTINMEKFNSGFVDEVMHTPTNKVEVNSFSHLVLSLNERFGEPIVEASTRQLFQTADNKWSGMKAFKERLTDYIVNDTPMHQEDQKYLISYIEQISRLYLNKK